MINEAGIIAGYAGRKKIQREDIVQACIRFLFGYPFPQKSKFDDATKRVALHEAGHVVVAEVLERGSVIASYIGIGNGRVGGFTKTRKDGNYVFFKKKVENHIICMLGGKAAVEVMDCEADIGCSEDISYAYHEVREFIDDYGMFGFDSYESGEASNETKSIKERRISMEMERYSQIAKQIINENRALLGAIQVALMENRFITGKEIVKIREGIERIN